MANAQFRTIAPARSAAAALDHRALFDASPNPYLVLDRRLHIAGANQAYLAGVKRELADIVGRWAWDAFPGDAETVRQAVASFERVIHTRQPDTMALLRFDVPRPEAEGGGFEERYWSITHAPVLGADGEVEFVLQHPIDVTALQRLQRAIERSGLSTTLAITPAQSGIFDRAQSIYETNLALKAESDRFNEMFAQAPSFMALLRGPEHRIEMANPGYLALVGHRPVLGRTVREALPDAVAQGYLALLDQVFRSGEAYRADAATYAVQAEPGGPIDGRLVDFVFQPIRDREGVVDGIFVEGTDVTERAQAFAALRENEARLRLVVEEARDHAILTITAAGTITSWSAGAAAIFGWSPAEIIGQPYGTIFTAADRARRADWSEIEGAARDGVAPDERWHVRRDGAQVYLSGSVRPLPPRPSEPPHFLKVARDDTERWRAENRRETLIRLTDRLRDAGDPADIAYAAAAVLGQSLSISRAGYATVDHDAETLLVERDWTAPGVGTLAGTQRLRDFGSYVEALKAGEFIAVPDVTCDRSDSLAPAALVAIHARSFVNVPVLERGRLVAVFFISDAAVRHWPPEDLALVREVAERTRTAVERARGEAALRESALRLRDANETLEANVQARTRELMASEEALRQSQKMEAVGQLTGGLAHDFNNLLLGVTGSLELLQARLARGMITDADRYVTAARDAATRAAALTHRLLAFSRRQTLAPKPTDIDRLVRGIEELIGRTVGPAIAVESNVDEGGVWPVLVDPSQLENALLNLCINARDAMPDGGRITVETANRWLDQRQAADLAPGPYVSLCVSDTGTGMSADVIARAFEPFFTTKPIGQGTGLGLSMIYGFARQSGGQARITSEIGRGTTVCIYLPRHGGEADRVEAAPALADAPRAEEGQTVLVVDDESTIRMLVAEVLQGRGYSAIEAADGPAALAVLQSDVRIDLLVSDVGLPGGMNGRQVADAARATRPDLKVLFITGYAESAVLGDGSLEPGMHVLTKPFALDVLASRVKELIAEG